MLPKQWYNQQRRRSKLKIHYFQKLIDLWVKRVYVRSEINPLFHCLFLLGMNTDINLRETHALSKYYAVFRNR